MEFITHLMSFLVGMIGGYVLKVVIDVKIGKDQSTTETKQEGNIVAGDQAGRDIKK